MDIKFSSLIVLLVIHGISGCFFSTKQNRYQCANLVELSAEGNDTWTSLIVYDAKKRSLNLKPNGFKRTPNLTHLELCFLQSVEVGAFDGLSKLDFIGIYDSEIASIPSEVFKSLSIRKLQILKSNFLTLTPGYFENLPDVIQVDLRKNSFKTIQLGVFNGTTIYKIYLDFSEISKIEDNAFANMDALVDLSLTGNLLENFDSKRILGTSTSLIKLWLNKNKLSSVGKEIFEGIPYLEKINLDFNQITTIEDGAFNKVPNLDFIDLSNNHLAEIQPKIFPIAGLNKLDYLILHNNRLTFINKSLFYRIPNLKYITYGGNPFQCPCFDELKGTVYQRNITQLCDNVYYQGERPSCVLGMLAPKECLYDAELNENLYDMYTTAMDEYPKLELKCDTTQGAMAASLGSKF